MSAFTGKLTVSHMDVDWRLWMLEQPFIYEVGAKGSGRVIEVPKGFMTDGASVPRFLWAVLPTWGSYSRAAVIHDYLLYCLARGEPHPEAPTREAADLIFDEACCVCNVPILLRWLLSIGVRIGTLKARWERRPPYTRVSP